MSGDFPEFKLHVAAMAFYAGGARSLDVDDGLENARDAARMAGEESPQESPEPTLTSALGPAFGASSFPAILAFGVAFALPLHIAGVIHASAS
jgi:hypothetical protein